MWVQAYPEDKATLEGVNILRNIALILKYRGTNYHGWQSQNNAVAIQDVLSRAIKKLTGSAPIPHLEGCGRTDAGVHALSYVANFKTETAIAAERLAPALNALLPEDISVSKALDVDDDFHARFNCRKKEYVYKIYDCAHRDPFFAGLALHHPFRLDHELMDRAARHLQGTHDFSAFRAAGSKVNGSVRTMFAAKVWREGDLVSLSFLADGFLYNMVRILAGTLVYISEGKIVADALPEIIRSGDRNAAGKTLPPCGLYLAKVWYDAGCIDG